MAHPALTSLGIVLVAGSLVACGGSESGDPGGTAGSGASAGSSGSAGTGGSSGSGGGSGSGGAAGDWRPLVEGNWEMQSGNEGYWCVVQTVPEDLYISAFRAVAPEGTHHTLLLYANQSVDGEFPCGPTLDDSVIFASGVGTDDLSFPPGVALKIEKGSQILLNLHLFNTSANKLTGTSGTLIKTLAPEEVVNEAEMILTGPTDIYIPPNGEKQVSGDCTFSSSATVSTVWPHMHQYGTHMKVTHHGKSGATILHDAPYSFAEQVNYPIEPVTIAGGEKVTVECSYVNPTAVGIPFGDSSEDEMCFAGLYRYPKLGDGCF